MSLFLTLKHLHLLLAFIETQYKNQDMNQKKSKLEKVGPFKALSSKGIQWDGPKAVIFHGYGADANDLFDLSQHMDPNGAFNWIFPNGPLEIPIAPGFFGRAWFPIDIEAHEAAAQKGKGVDYSNQRMKGMDEALEKALSFLQALDFKPNTDILGGFSQGSMMSVEIATRLPVSPKALLIFSGALVDSQNLQNYEALFRGARIYQSHGAQDTVLPVLGAKKLYDSLKKMGANIQWHEFHGGHEIPFEVLSRAAQFLK